MEALTVGAGLLLAVAVAIAVAAGAIAVGVPQLLRARRAETEVARLRDELRAERHAACHDPLTGLPNRRAFYRSAPTLMADTARRPLVAVLVDLDDFKQVNDTLGHAVGDQVLVAMASRFSELAGNGLVARLGGDEFVGLLHWPAADSRALQRTARKLADTLAAPIRVAGHGIAVTASVGLAAVAGAADLDDLVGSADAAMYRAKSTRGSVFLTDGWAAEPTPAPAAQQRTPTFQWLPPRTEHLRHVHAAGNRMAGL